MKKGSTINDGGENVRRKRSITILYEIILVMVTFIMALPLFLAITISFQKPEAVFSYPPKFFPTSFYWKNYVEAFKYVPLARLFLNSLIVASLITLGKLATGALAGFAFSHFNFKGKKVMFAALFATLFLPAETVMILPLFLIMKTFGWVNTYWALTIPFMASATNTFLMRQHFLTIPRELQDAALIDGASYMQFFWKVLIPLSKHMLAGASIINFVYAWNMYLWPLIVSMEDKMKTVQVGVKMLMQAESANNWGVIMAGTVVALAPTVVMFLALQNLFVKSLVRSGMKG
ncbi:MAG: sn-glycerol 3-phosphate transport system permease protein [Thermotoga sp.]|nr:sn-glycerol 3-phosphate transport system permease protein [Thermotoga sp.]